MINKKTLSERDICTKYITPAITAAGWDVQSVRASHAPSPSTGMTNGASSIENGVWSLSGRGRYIKVKRHPSPSRSGRTE